MKKVFTIFLVLCMCCQCVMQLGIIAWYQMNREYVSTVLCENKARPELKCCGKCYLRKQLRKTEEQGTGKPLVEKQQKTDVIFLLPERIAVPFIAEAQQPILRDRYAASYHAAAITDIFHPPSFIQVTT